MKFLCLIHVSLLWIQASCSEGQAWTVNITPSTINTTVGSTVEISCSFTYPPEEHTDDVKVYWKRPRKSSFPFKDNDINAFIFHENSSFVEKEYRNKTRLIGDATKRDCSLMIQNITLTELEIYVRVVGKIKPYSFVKKPVSIYLSGVQAVTLRPDERFGPATYEPIPTTGSNEEQASLSYLYLAVFVPVAAILLICLMTGIVIFIKRKRSQSFTRAESGYYVNFSRAPSDPLKREEPSKKLDNKQLKQLAEPKAIDDPVYINFEASSGPINRGMDHTDNVYGNVDYS